MVNNSSASHITRIRYHKTGKAVYISHLDLMTVMQRSFIRAGVNLKYSEGFNPHPYLSVALPSSVGTESVCELLDVALRGGSIREDINKYLPEGLKIYKAYRPYRKFSDIKWLDVRCRLKYDHISLQDIKSIADNITELFNAESMFITKKTKRGVSTFDAASHISNIEIESNDNCIEIAARISAQNPTISQKDFISIITNDSKVKIPDIFKMKRIEIMDKNMLLFE